MASTRVPRRSGGLPSTNIRGVAAAAAAAQLSPSAVATNHTQLLTLAMPSYFRNITYHVAQEQIKCKRKNFLRRQQRRVRKMHLRNKAATSVANGDAPTGNSLSATTTGGEPSETGTFAGQRESNEPIDVPPNASATRERVSPGSRPRLVPCGTQCYVREKLIYILLIYS